MHWNVSMLFRQLVSCFSCWHWHLVSEFNLQPGAPNLSVLWTFICVWNTRRLSFSPVGDKLGSQQLFSQEFSLEVWGSVWSEHAPTAPGFEFMFQLFGIFSLLCWVVAANKKPQVLVLWLFCLFLVIDFLLFIFCFPFPFSKVWDVESRKNIQQVRSWLAFDPCPGAEAGSLIQKACWIMLHVKCWNVNILFFDYDQNGSLKVVC